MKYYFAMSTGRACWPCVCLRLDEQDSCVSCSTAVSFSGNYSDTVTTSINIMSEKCYVKFETETRLNIQEPVLAPTKTHFSSTKNYLVKAV